MFWAQVTLLVLTGIGLLVFANQHGEPRTGKWNFWAHLLVATINFFLLWAAGAYSLIFGTLGS